MFYVGNRHLCRTPVRFLIDSKLTSYKSNLILST